MKIFLQVVVLVMLLPVSLHAQWKKTPLSSTQPASQNQAFSLGRTKATSLALPFWDDFSFTEINDTTGRGIAFPIDSLWENSRSVSINAGVGLQPPTLNVATFDGINATGKPYSTQVLINGFRDTLTSQPIRLNEVAPAQRQTVYLSFFFQYQGNGEPPDLTDYMQLEFKNDQGSWVEVMTIETNSSRDPTVFYDTILQVEGDQYFHDSFQFRFKNYGRLSGAFDTWNIDYIYLNKGRNILDLSFPDRAISTPLGNLFGRYRAVPYAHFQLDKALTQPTFEIQNLKDLPVSVNFRTAATYYHISGEDTSLYETVIANQTPINIINNVLLAKEHKLIRLDTLPDVNDPNQFPEDVDQSIIRLQVTLQTNDNVPQNTLPPIEPDSTGDYTRNYIPIDFRRNDTTYAYYYLSDFYAYDDGSAEYAAGLTQTGNRAAVKFEMLASGGILDGIQLFIPHTGTDEPITTDFYVYSDANGIPGPALFTLSSRILQAEKFNSYQLLATPALPLPRIFYIGWRAPATTTLQIGLDLNTDSGDQIYTNVNGSWIQNTELRGSLMIRPIVREGTPTGIDKEETITQIYPNPNSGTFYMHGEVEILEIYNLSGNTIPFSVIQTPTNTQVTLINPVTNLYLVRARVGSKLITRKIVVK